MSNFGINHFLDLGAPYRNFGTGNKAGVDYQPRYRALCGSWIQAGAGSHVITEITCDECLEALLKMVLNNLVLVETGNYEAIEAGWGFVRARREREEPSGVPHRPRGATRVAGL